MNKCLDALNRLKMYANCCECDYESNPNEDYEIVEKELKRLEEIDDILNTGGGIWAENGIVSKKLKVLEILKVILFSKLKMFETTEKVDKTTITKGNYYVIEFRVGKEKEQLYIPKEEYDLLKEVIL